MKPTTRGVSVRLRSLVFAVAVGMLAVSIAACGSSKKSSTGAQKGPTGGSISGAGATFPAPVYEEWASRFKSKYGTTVNYNAIGSGGGIAAFTAGTVDFGASDAFMKDDEVKAAQKKGAPVHVPTVFGAITVSYHVSGLAKGLKLDGPTIASIFLGTVKKWDDAAIKKLNPGMNLPSTAITVVHRSDSSGTTKLFTSFLDKQSPQWHSKVGTDKTVKWPTGTGAKGNDGVAGAVKQTEGAVGYVEEAYALQNNFTTAAVKNKAGAYVLPTLASTTAAGEGIQVPADLRFSAIGASTNPGAYPIASATFLLVYQDMCKAGIPKDRAVRVWNWLNYGQTDGQQVAPTLQYAPLPASIATQAKAKVDGLVCNGSSLKAAAGL
jgi:phosphate transport system substrate-binding protein